MRRRRLARLVPLLLAAAMAAGCTVVTPTPVATAPVPAGATTAGSTTSAGAGACRAGNPLANVYHPYRLTVLAPCATVTGTVAFEHNDEADGDFHIDVRLDPPYASSLNAVNRSQQHGDLVVEVVPADEPGCTVGRPPKPAHGTYNYGTCTGADIPPPPIGARVRVVGPWVLDTDHGWREIHPAWSITVLRP